MADGRRRGPYKLYLTDPNVDVPKTTARRLQAKCPRIEDVGESNNISLQQDYPPEESVTNETKSDGEELFFSLNDYDCEQIYNGSTVTVKEAVFFILSIFLEFSLTRECLGKILELLTMLLPHDSKIPKTKYLLFQYLKGFSSTIDTPQVHSFCSNCTSYLGNEKIATCSHCNLKSTNCFVQYSIKSVLKSALENQKLFRYFKNSISIQGNINFISDIYDGSQYKHCTQELSRNDILLMWNTDGIQVFESSNTQLWPIQFTILNLPPKLRHKFIYIAGLFKGQFKPQMNSFLFPFIKELKELASYGLEWVNSDTKEQVISKVFAPVCSVDSPARSSIQNIKQFNGEFGCFACEHPGKIYFLENGGHSRIYPYEKGLEYPLRSKMEMKKQAKTAVESSESVKGVKGPSCVHLLPKFDIALSFIPDYMHCVLLGVIRYFTCAWFETNNHSKLWYLGRKMNEVNERLSSISVPNFIKRMPRSLNNRKNWKASEWRGWLLFYCLPCLVGLLPTKYLQHLMLLIMGIHSLLKEKISLDCITDAQKFFSQFIVEIPFLYSAKYCTYNVHCLLHLPNAVKQWGPLWATSAFPFESNNGKLLKMIKGTQAIEKQLTNLITITHGFNFIRSQINEGQNLNCKNKIVLQLDDNSFVKLIGKGKTKNLSDDLLRQIELVAGQEIDVGQILVYYRIIHENQLYSSEKYPCKKRNTYTVIFRSKNCNFDRFGSVLYYIKSKDKLFALINEYEVTNEAFKNTETGIFLSFIKKIEKKNQTIIVIPFKSIVKLCIKVNNYICLQPNMIEINL